MVDPTDIGISSLVDAWIALRGMERESARRNELFVLQTRGIGHSREIIEYVIKDSGLRHRQAMRQGESR